MTTDLRCETAAIQTEPHDTVETVLARAMPWAISLFLHVGLAMVMMLVAMMAMGSPRQPVGPQDSPTLGLAGPLEWPRVGGPDQGPYIGPGPKGKGGANGDADLSVWVPDDQRDYMKKTDKPVDGLMSGTSHLDSLIAVIGFGGQVRQGLNQKPFLGEVGILRRRARGFGDPNDPNAGGGGGRGPCSVVFVIDRSGSMVESLDRLVREMGDAIAYLGDESVENRDYFHVIFFAGGAPLENAPRRLVPATAGNRKNAAEFLETIRAEGQTDPVPALRRAFEVLHQAEPKTGKMIYFLTDGVFGDNAAVLEVIKKMNQKKDVHIFSFLYGHCPEDAVKVMKQVASENGGRYKYVALDE